MSNQHDESTRLRSCAQCQHWVTRSVRRAAPPFLCTSFPNPAPEFGGRDSKPSGSVSSWPGIAAKSVSVSTLAHWHRWPKPTSSVIHPMLAGFYPSGASPAPEFAAPSLARGQLVVFCIFQAEVSRLTKEGDHCWPHDGYATF